MAKKHRQGRLSEEIKKSISSLLINGIKDPRLSERIITVSGVEVTADAGYATCYVTPLVLADEDREEVCATVLRAFESATGMFRKQIGRDIKLRHVPELIFKIDSSMEYGRHIDEILDTLTYNNQDPETEEELLENKEDTSSEMSVGLSLPEMAARILESDRIVILPHVHMDGDALGSSSALCMALRGLGKKTHVFCYEDTPHNLDFLEMDCVTRDFADISDAELAIMVDCSSISRIRWREEAFLNAPIKAYIDHHGVTEGDTQFDFGMVDPASAATGELIYLLLKEMNVEMTLPLAQCLFAAISTDTGNFQYSNTTRRSHEIAATFYDVPGFDSKEISALLYERNSLASLKLEGLVIDSINMYADGKIAVGRVTDAMLAATGCVLSESEGFVNVLLGIDGVEIACLLKDVRGERVRVSLRAKSYADVARVAQAIGGGGHVRAAGGIIEGSVDNAEAILAPLMEQEV